MVSPVTRFAPSPTGYLHVGHVYAALFAERAAREAEGEVLLRIEDIDKGRCRPEFEAAILDDLAWLGLSWDGPVLRQSERGAEYRAALNWLEDLGVLYPCFCTRRDIAAEIARAAAAPHGPETGPDGPQYPGLCRGLDPEEARARIAAGEAHALRLDAAKAGALAGPLAFTDRAHGQFEVDAGLLGDAVLARKDIGTSYHLSVVVDDAAQGVTLVTRGADLLPATHLHRVLQALLELPAPEYHHHRLLMDSAGERLAKRADSQSIRALREEGLAPEEVRAMAGFADAPARLEARGNP